MNGRFGEVLKNVKNKAQNITLPKIQLGRNTPSSSSGIPRLGWIYRITTFSKDILRRYEQFTGVTEVLKLQSQVVLAQDKFVAAQDKRRESSNKLIALQWRLKEIHDEMQTTPKGEEKYLKLVTEEHKLIIEETQIRQEFLAAEKEERDHFNAMSTAVKISHEQERAHTDRNKYWYVVASLVGTGLGVLGSTVNNRMKMSEFRDMFMLQSQVPNLQTGSGERYNVEAEKNREKLLKDLESRVLAIMKNQGMILQTIQATDKIIDSRFKELKHLIIKSTALNDKHEKELMDIHSLYQHSPESTPVAPSPTLADVLPNENVIKISLAIAVCVLFGLFSLR